MPTILCLALLTLLTSAFYQPARAQQVRRIGYLAFRGEAGPNSQSFKQGMLELGYSEGQNLVIESRSAAGKVERIPQILSDFVDSKVDVIVVGNVQAAHAAKKATQSISIVFAIADDPVAIGLVASFARPGGNVTGITDLAQHLSAKRVELLKEAIPKLSRLCMILWSPTGQGGDAEKNEIEFTTRSLGIKLRPVEVHGSSELEGTFSTMTREGCEAFIGATDTRFATNRDQIARLSIKNRLPAVYPDRTFVDAGGLMSYATNRILWRRRLAVYVDKILKGAKPADLPVEQPTKFELVINLKTARQIGLTIPPNVLARADRVIK